MTKRRSRGEGELRWDETRQRWIATFTVGYTPDGRRIRKKATGKTKTEAKEKLKEIIRDYEDGLTLARGNATVEEAVNDWLNFELSRRDTATYEAGQTMCRLHVIPALGKLKLRELSAQDVDKWLMAKSKALSTSTLRLIRSYLNRSVKRAMARDLVKRNVVELCSVPRGKEGRPSKALTLAQAEAVLKAAEGARMQGYIVLALLTGARTEELRALTWDHVDLDGDPEAVPAVPPHVAVWRSVRAGGDTKTRKSRRTLALPQRAVEALQTQKAQQEEEKKAAGGRWTDQGLVFASLVGTELDSHNVRRAFRLIIAKTDLDPTKWTPRELRHSFVSLLSDQGIPLEEISRLVGHSSTAVTELVYRKQIRPVIQEGAKAMDRIFKI
ncbi:tyrosine-type recombinase/integrase [Nonomuraea soli]|uniref:Integrase n=1 Tax=Nonomuraea soli TaxID=1032476 RepID=A0A7W0CJ23_9ACTN|nr:tyrosine-type recombinase/integrase [Nonomuraea soli]MBA2892093.1 integrase [Nonomuraea soli]